MKLKLSTILLHVQLSCVEQGGRQVAEMFTEKVEIQERKHILSTWLLPGEKIRLLLRKHICTLPVTGAHPRPWRVNNCLPNVNNRKSTSHIAYKMCKAKDKKSVQTK